MSPRERSAWIRLVSIVVVFVPYFVYTTRLFERGEAAWRTLCIAFVVAAAAHAVVNTIGEIATSLSGCVMTDERDRAIDALSLRAAYFTLIVLILGALSTVAVLGLMTPSADASRTAPTFAAASQFVFFCFVASEALRHATQLVFYRRAASPFAR